MNATQTPQAEFQERAAEQAPAWLTIPQLAAVQNLRQMWASAQQRVADSHAVQMKSLGGEAGEVEDMGDISVSGDHTHTHYHAPASTMGDLAKKLIPLALAATVGSGAACIAWLVLNKPPAATPPTVTPPVITQPDSAWQLGIEVVNP